MNRLRRGRRAYAAGVMWLAGCIINSYVLEASFDTSNRVAQLRLLKGWGSEVPPTRELEKPR